VSEETSPEAADTGAFARLEARVTGRVQGVGYRYFVLDRAAALDVDGWVANEPDGSVRCVVEGDRRSLERFLAQLREGPRGARVERVDEAWLAPTHSLSGFTVRSGAHPGD